MIIKLTNASEEHKGNPLYVNVTHITCFFQQAKVEGGSLTTFIHCQQGNSITWEVEESPMEIMKQIETGYWSE